MGCTQDPRQVDPRFPHDQATGNQHSARRTRPPWSGQTTQTAPLHLHLTLKQDTTEPAAFNFLRQQERFDNFIEVYNNQRPHQALNGAYPDEVYTPSAREYKPPFEPDYPWHDRTIRVTRCGRICIGKRKINLSTVFAGQLVGIREVEDQIWLVSFLDYDLSYFDNERGRVEPGPNPFAPDKVLIMCPECTNLKLVPVDGFEPPTHALRMRCSTD